MHIKDWKKEVFTIPNLLSLFRLALIPVYIYIYLGATETYQYITMRHDHGGFLPDRPDRRKSRPALQYSLRWEKSSTRWPGKIHPVHLTVCLSLKHPQLFQCWRCSSSELFQSLWARCI